MTARRARRPRPCCARSRGLTAVETLVALPLVLLAGLFTLQAGLVLHARQAVMHGAIEAARAGAVAHADPARIRQGFARGLSPWFLGSVDEASHARAARPETTELLARVREHTGGSRPA